MNITADKIGALVFFIFSVCYGYYAFQIPLYPGEELEVFSSQTMPKVYAFTAIVISSLALILGFIDDIRNGSHVTTQSKDKFDRVGWMRIASLIGLMVFYGTTLEVLGFITSTILFLILGYLIMGERKIKTIILASVPVVIVFWAIMTQALGIYLTNGSLWS